MAPGVRMNSNGWLVRLAFVSLAAGGALMVFEACSEPVGKMLVDAGTVLVDAGADSGGSLADAGELMRDAGLALTEAGSGVRDGGADAAAQGAVSQFKSGSRIEMRVPIQKGADGSQYAGYPAPYDTERKEACSVMKMADGSIRCAPAAMYGYAVFFADAGCSQRITLSGKGGCTPPAYIYEPPTSCGAGPRLFMRGAKAATLFAGSPSACTEQTNIYATTNDFYLFGAEIPPSAFVEFTDDGHVAL